MHFLTIRAIPGSFEGPQQENSPLNSSISHFKDVVNEVD